MLAHNAVDKTKTVADPNAEYASMYPIWKKCQAACTGESAVKTYDAVLDVMSFTNLLIPFSPSMSPEQYRFYKAEAEFPGITTEFSKMIVGGLLRKKPSLSFTNTAVTEDMKDWLLNGFGQDGSSLTAFLSTALEEEIVTSRAWVFIEHPVVPDYENLSREERKKIHPYPVLWRAKDVINWKTTKAADGSLVLSQVIVKTFEEDISDNEFHPDIIEVVSVYELHEGHYRIRKFRKEVEARSVAVVNGVKSHNFNKEIYTLHETIEEILVNGKKLDYLPIFPLNGSIDIVQPILATIVDKEISLYNKVSRRNHLLYGAATYTPTISADITDAQFEAIVSQGLGGWILLPEGGSASVLDTPTDALKDMDRAIAAGVEELAKLGIRMLSPETAQSGVALEIRNAAQTAKLGSLNAKISSTMEKIVRFMVYWDSGLQLSDADIDFSLSDDFNPVPLGADWLRLATEWYEGGLIPRSAWLMLLKQNDVLDSDYNDESAKVEMKQDDFVEKDDGKDEVFD